jgi:hypothetical protein
MIVRRGDLTLISGTACARVLHHRAVHLETRRHRRVPYGGLRQLPHHPGHARRHHRRRPGPRPHRHPAIVRSGQGMTFGWLLGLAVRLPSCHLTTRMSGASPGRRAMLKLQFLAAPLHVSGRAAMQLGEFYVRGSVTLDRRALCFGQLKPDLARHSGDQHSLRDLLPFDEGTDLRAPPPGDSRILVYPGFPLADIFPLLEPADPIYQAPQPFQLSSSALSPAATQPGHRVSRQSPGREPRRLRRGSVEPLLVIYYAHERPVSGYLRQQAQHGQAHQEAIGRRPRAEAQRGPQRLLLRRRQPVEPIQHGRTQLMQTRRRQLHPRLHPGGALDPAPSRTSGQVSSSAVLPTSGSPLITSTRLSLDRTASTIRSSTAISPGRPRSCAARVGRQECVAIGSSDLAACY